MSQVQIRQIPAKSFSTNPQIIGSWFPTGYYGHFRAKSRIELCNDFRQLARPDPPKKFLQRQNSEASTHKFSQHDNRFKFECDPLVRSTTEGFGRRKLRTSAHGKFDPFFISWGPKASNQNESIEDINSSSYNHDYNSNSTSQILSNVEPLRSPSPSFELSAYSSVYNHGQPNSEQSKKIRQETFQRYASAFSRRSQIKRTERSTSVAACLIWNDVNGENKLPPANEPTTKSMTFNTNINDNDLPTNNKSQQYENQSMQIFNLGAMTSRDNHNTRRKSSCQRSSSLKETRISTMDGLITKYM